jgi:hypothetical protein
MIQGSQIPNDPIERSLDRAFSTAQVHCFCGRCPRRYWAAALLHFGTRSRVHPG